MHRLLASFIPPIALDFKSETPLYRQISTWFQRAILAGQLQPGQRVPSTRTLAEELGISCDPVLGRAAAASTPSLDYVGHFSISDPSSGATNCAAGRIR